MGLPNDNMQQIAQMLLKGNETAQTPPYIHPQAAANIGANIGTGIGGAVGPPGASAPPPTPPVTVQATPPPVTGPGDQLPMAQSPMGDQSLPPMPPPTHIGGPSTPGFWERFNKAISSGQVPEGYRGVMGELIKNG